ncbi:bacillithiol biosynthesis cysteine-adding enzyme BshC [Niallia sp. Krafla_26]|uniref:bacillithiol biosynthesis cysteine-adding enzyme BshC n=1 Tax=Niallia sp. Krafla_26 TaxID=3064703 RepID=UPI003D165B20
MEMLNLSLPATNPFATGYLAGASEIQKFFHYQFKNQSDYQKRLIELQNRKFMRRELSQCIELFMEPFPTSDEVKDSLLKLTDDQSVVVIGGQQAGILTGPLYSIHKVISIIAFAKQKEAELNIPVVPVFWIAGEDHDFQEVNHIYMEKEGKIQKVTYPEKVLEKKMVTDIELNREQCYKWVEEIIGELGETDYTNELLQFMKDSIERSKTFVDFFANIIMELFKKEGLLIIDSGFSGLRSLEKEIFISQIEQASKITDSVKVVQKSLNDNGYQPSIDISDQASNLFYYDEANQERILLEFEIDEQMFYGKNGMVRLTKEELLQIATEFPTKLSNNVVTRPITQELLFPTLAFIAGPGEIAYWAELKQAFELFSIKMPPIIPRLNITIVDRSVGTDLEELNLSIENVLVNGIETYEKEFLEHVKDQELEQLFQSAKDELLAQYQLIEDKIDKGLAPLFNKNREIILDQIHFMEQKSNEAIRNKHEVVLNKYKRVENKLFPLHSPQERILNPLPFLNAYGKTFFAELIHLPYEFDGLHKVLKI